MNVHYMPDQTTTDWLLLAASVPGRDATSTRVKLWRALRDVGAVNLRDGVTLVPASAETRSRFSLIARDIETDGGSAWVFAVPSQESVVESKLRALFDRSEAYRQLKPTTAALRKDLRTIDEATARRRFRQVERDFDAIAKTDFFPSVEQTKLHEAIEKLRGSIDQCFSPAEPSAAAGRISSRRARSFKRSIWATRKRLWVDRVASAWLIKRFIDPDAQFRWLDRPSDCPKEAHGFDFDGAEFTHVDSLVTFEVLVVAFQLSDDAGLSGLARVVHHLDVGGTEIVPEAAGFEAVLAGLRDNSSDDDQLLAATSPMLDALYQHFLHTKTT